MADREKVIKGLEQCKEGGSCDGCQYDINSSKCIFLLHADALALLKEQEHKDKMYHALEDDWKRLKELLKEQQGTGCWEWITEDKYRCSECQNTTYVDECMEEPQYLFCPYCGHKMTFAGRSVKWE